MIDDSGPWKRDLGREAVTLSRALGRFKSGRNDVSDALFYKVERFCFLSAFIVRRLLEAEKLSQEVERTTLAARTFRRRTRGFRGFDVLTRGDVEKRYVLSASATSRIALAPLCNMLVHTADFVIVEYPKRSLRLFFSSEKHARRLFSVTLEDVVSLVREVSQDDVCYAHWERDPVSNLMRNVVRSRVSQEH
jgi:hypothetical protein